MVKSGTSLVGRALSAALRYAPDVPGLNPVPILAARLRRCGHALVPPARLPHEVVLVVGAHLEAAGGVVGPRVFRALCVQCCPTGTVRAPNFPRPQATVTAPVVLALAPGTCKQARREGQI